MHTDSPTSPTPTTTPPSAPSPGISAADRVYRHLKRAILEQIHADGALLTECDIAAEVGVSRTPVRSALLRLESEGLVALYPKRGALVLPVSAQEVEDVIEARRLVETHTAGRAWQRRAFLADTLVPLLEAMRTAHADSDAAAFMLADRAFHQACVDAAGNRILTELYHRLRDRQMRIGIASMRLAPHRMDRALADHDALLAALAADDEAAWHALVDQHVGTAAGHLRPHRPESGAVADGGSR
jgi:DNA-binding GntR family transcriptional regulator